MRRSQIILRGVLIVMALGASPLAAAGVVDLSYSGRFVDDAGMPLAGPVDVAIRFYGSVSGEDQLGETIRYRAVPLTEGVMQLTIGLDAAQQTAVLGDGSRRVYLEVEAGGRVYPRQSYAAVPMALRIPVDNNQLVFAPETSQLMIDHIEIDQVTGLAAVLATNALTGDTTFKGSGGVVTDGVIRGKNHIVVDSNGSDTKELRFAERDGSNYVGFKAANSLSADKIWTLPVADGTSGSLLSTDGNGNLSWVTPGGGGDMIAANNLSDLADKASARGHLGLGSLATLSSLGTNEVVDGSLLNVDIASTAGIATTKLSGSLLAVVGHGLGVLAGKSVVDGSDISNGTIMDADISSSAAIATAKISGSLFGVSNHGLGELAGLSSVNSARISNDSIVDADISSLAAISDTKLANITAVGKVSGNAITSGNISGATSFSGSGGVQTSGMISTSSGVVIQASAGVAKELRFQDATNSNFVALRAAGSLAGNLTWTLPDADGGAGQVLQTDGAGVLSWTSGLAPTGTAGGDLTGNFPTPQLTLTGVAGGNYVRVAVNPQGRVTAGSSTIGSSEIADGSLVNADVSSAAGIATSKLSGPVIAMANHGLGALAVLNSVSSALIDNSAIIDADVAAGAAIATSKLSGSLMAISGHGLGSLATANGITSAMIDNSTIVDADVAAGAAIATSKLSGSLMAISGHGLGSLATANGITSAMIDNSTIVDADVAAGAAIAGSKISFAEDGISGNKIHSGVISDFSSTGIDDNSAGLAVTINSSGNVGIGTTVPVTRLHVLTTDANTVFGADSNQIGMALQNSNSTNGSWTRISFRGANGANAGDIGVQVTDQANGYGDIAFATRGSGGWGERLRITGNGNVGIGTTSPTAVLDVNGTLRAKNIVHESFTVTPAGTYDGASRTWVRLQFTGMNAGSTPPKIKISRNINSNAGTPYGGPVLDLTLFAGSEWHFNTGGWQLNYSEHGTIPSQYISQVAFLDETSAKYGVYFYMLRGIDYTVEITEGSAPYEGVNVNSAAPTSSATIGYGTNFGRGTTTTQTIGSGNVGIGTTAPGSRLHLGNSLLVANPNSYSVATSGEGLLINDQEIVSYNSERVVDLVALGLQNGTAGGGGFRFVTNPANSNSAVERMRITASGNVGIGASSPRAGLDVTNGALLTKAATNNASATTIDFSTGNMQYTSANCGAFTLNNLKDGGSFLLIIKGATAATCSFTASGFTLHMPTDHTATTANKHTMYNFLVAGTDIYVSWATGL